MEKISIVVPVYNTERVVGKCIESIIRQEYPRIELILVNDGSTDNSLVVLREYQKRYPDKIVVVDKQNEGVDKARKYGVEHASGEFLMFVDSDDLLVDGAIKKLYETQRKYSVDVVGAEYSKFASIFTKPSRIFKGAEPYYNRKLTRDELMKDLYISFFGINKFNTFLWGKLYKKDLFNDWQVSGLRFCEDLLVLMRVFPRIQSMYLLKDRLYKYRIGGGTSKFMPYFLADNKRAYRLKKEELIKNNFSDGFLPICWELKNEVKFQINQMLFYNKESDEKWLEEEFKDDVYDDFDRVLSDGYDPKSEVDNAIYHRDAKKAWQLMVASYHPWSPRVLAKRIMKLFF